LSAALFFPARRFLKKNRRYRRRTAGICITLSACSKRHSGQYEFVSSAGMTMIQEITLKQNGTVTRCENGVLFDPVLSIRACSISGKTLGAQGIAAEMRPKTVAYRLFDLCTQHKLF
jgi:hypothetical protein